MRRRHSLRRRLAQDAGPKTQFGAARPPSSADLRDTSKRERVSPAPPRSQRHAAGVAGRPRSCLGPSTRGHSTSRRSDRALGRSCRVARGGLGRHSSGRRWNGDSGSGPDPRGSAQGHPTSIFRPKLQNFIALTSGLKFCIFHNFSVWESETMQRTYVAFWRK